jgi:hypothetical protein
MLWPFVAKTTYGGHLAQSNDPGSKGIAIREKRDGGVEGVGKPANECHCNEMVWMLCLQCLALLFAMSCNDGGCIGALQNALHCALDSGSCMCILHTALIEHPALCIGMLHCNVNECVR